MLIWQLIITRAKYFEGSVNSSNEASKRSFRGLAQLLETKCEEQLLFSEDDFENDGHETEILCRVGPISPEKLLRNVWSVEGRVNEKFERVFIDNNGTKKLQEFSRIYPVPGRVELKRYKI